jgi:hypothetical protein
MNGRIKVCIYYLPENQDNKYGETEKKIYEQTINEQWINQTNPGYFQKVVCAFNGIELKEEMT